MKAKELLALFESNRPSEEAVAQSLEKLIASFKLNVQVEQVDVDLLGGITVAFSDDESNILDLFFYWENDTAYAVIQTEGTESTLFDLGSCAPSCIDAGSSGRYVDLIDTSWINKSTLVALLSQGVEVKQPSQPPLKRYDAYGNVLPEAYVGRGSKRSRMPICSSLNKGQQAMHPAFHPKWKRSGRATALNGVEA